MIGSPEGPSPPSGSSAEGVSGSAGASPPSGEHAASVTISAAAAPMVAIFECVFILRTSVGLDENDGQEELRSSTKPLFGIAIVWHSPQIVNQSIACFGCVSRLAVLRHPGCTSRRLQS